MLQMFLCYEINKYPTCNLSHRDSRHFDINLLIFGFRGKFNFELIRNMEYTFSEYADMHLMYGLASCNALEARRLYHERFPDKIIPNHKTFQRVDQRLRENGGRFKLLK